MVNAFIVEVFSLQQPPSAPCLPILFLKTLLFSTLSSIVFFITFDYITSSTTKSNKESRNFFICLLNGPVDKLPLPTLSMSQNFYFYDIRLPFCIYLMLRPKGAIWAKRSVARYMLLGDVPLDFFCFHCFSQFISPLKKS